MQGLDWNKATAAVLVALITVKVASLIGNGIVRVEPLAKPAIEIVVHETPAPGASTLVRAEVVEAVEPLLKSANLENGKVVFAKCKSCHTLEKGAPDLVGPNQWNLVGAKFAHKEGYSYSAALQEMAVKGESWTYDKLNKFLYNPQKLIKGTKMVFAGLRKAQDRADLILYLRSMSDAPPALPQ